MIGDREPAEGENRISVPERNPEPPVRFLRASHAAFTSRDLAKSREFYTEVLGLVVSDEDKDTLYLRGLEERAHHSLTIKRTQDEPACLRVGMRVHDEEDLERAKQFEKYDIVEVDAATDIAHIPVDTAALCLLNVAAGYATRPPVNSTG